MTTLRRGEMRVPTEEELRKGFEIGEWEILPDRGIFCRGDQEERPEPKVFGVFLSLAKRDGGLVTKDDLIAENWDGRAIGDEPIARCLAQLRGHLGDRERPHQYIETLTRRGYRLIQPVRLKETAAAAPPSHQSSLPSRRYWLAGAVAAVLAILAVTLFLNGTFGGGIADIRSVAVLPFDFPGASGEDEHIAFGLKAEVMQTLRNVPELLVKDGRKRYDNELTDIAEILDVDGLLTATVQREAESLKIAYNLVDGRTGHIRSSGSVTGITEEMFALQEEFARAVRSDLLGKQRQQLVSSSRPSNAGAYDSYLRGLYEFDHRGSPENLEEAIDLFKETISLDSGFGPAYLMLAKAYVLLPDFRNKPLAESHEMALDAVEQGIAVDESIRDAAAAVLGLVYHKQKRWAESEEAYLRATSALIVDGDAYNWYSRMLASVGRLDEALAQSLAGLEIDPSGAVSNSRLATVYTWVGESEMAAEYFDRSNQLGHSGAPYLVTYALFLIREGRLDEAEELANSAVALGDGAGGWVAPLFAALRDPAKIPSAIEAIDLASADGGLEPRIEITARSMLGDQDGAMSVARLLEQPGEAFEMDLLFVPELLPLRQHPEFLDLMANLGVTDYWDETGCVWAESAVHCPRKL